MGRSGGGAGPTSFVGKPDLSLYFDCSGDLAGHADVGLDCVVVSDGDVVLPGVAGRAGGVFWERGECGCGKGKKVGPGDPKGAHAVGRRLCHDRR